MKEEARQSKRLTLDIVVTVVFVILKLLGMIEWNWFWVLSPLWISLLVSLLIIGITTYLAFLRYRKK